MRCSQCKVCCERKTKKRRATARLCDRGAPLSALSQRKKASTALLILFSFPLLLIPTPPSFPPPFYTHTPRLFQPPPQLGGRRGGERVLLPHPSPRRSSSAGAAHFVHRPPRDFSTADLHRPPPLQQHGRHFCEHVGSGGSRKDSACSAHDRKTCVISCKRGDASLGAAAATRFSNARV